jgi:secondary thiamine-phosphate synthase enzyme
MTAIRRTEPERLPGRAAPHAPGGFVSRVETLSYLTSGPTFVDITEDVRAAVRRSGVTQGVVHVFSQHTTAAIRVNENEPLLMADFVRLLNRLAPEGDYDHDDMTRRVGVPPDERPNGHAHCRHLLLGGSETLPVVGGELVLGRWQSVFLIELDGGRPRNVTVHTMGG